MFPCHYSKRILRKYVLIEINFVSKAILDILWRINRIVRYIFDSGNDIDLLYPEISVDSDPVAITKTAQMPRSVLKATVALTGYFIKSISDISIIKIGDQHTIVGLYYRSCLQYFCNNLIPFEFNKR